MTTCFISYSWDSVSHKGWVDRLAKTLEKFGLQVVYDQDRSRNPRGGDIADFIRTGIQTSDFVIIVVTPGYVQKANDTHGYVGQETTLIQSRIALRRRGILPILREGGEMPAYLHARHYVDMQDDSQFAGQVTELLAAMDALGAGIAPRDAVFDEGNPLPGKVFAIELLRSPVCLRRLNQRMFVSISRAGVELAVYTVPGRQRVVDQTFAGSDAVERAKELDEQVHLILLGKRAPEEYQLRQPNLRWASGGVLSRVQYRRRTWFSFFFRDIPPYGWNITLGASEHDDELTDPWRFLMREFLEETLVCHQPANAPGTIRRPLVFNEPIIVDEQIRQAERLSAKHRRLRFERDRVNFRQAPGDPVCCDIWPTRMEIDIDGGQPMRNVLICINLTELGIEVLKVLSYDLDDDDFLLDGEILEPAGRDQVELVRMPVALISEDYLRRAFAGRERFAFCYPCDARLPSIEGPTIRESEIIIFPHDVRRRAELALDEEGRATAWEKERYTLWLDRFGDNFLKEDKPTNASANSLFTPTSAKAMAYYFANA